DADIGLGERRRIIGAVAAHRHQLALGLLLADEAQLVLRRRLREKVVDAGFRGDGRRSRWIVAGHHDGADTHAPQLGEPLTDAPLAYVLERDAPEQLAVATTRQRRAAGLGDAVGERL